MTRDWLVIARKDFQYTRRSNVLLAIVAVFTLLTLGIVAGPGLFALVIGESVSNIPSVRLFEATAAAAGSIIPITALVGAYLAVAGERESGRIRLLLGMLPDRRDLVVGKFVARSGVVLSAVAIAYALAIVASLLVYREVPLGTAVETAALVGLLGVVFVAIGVGISAFSSSRARAIALVTVFYVFVVVIWDVFLQASDALWSLVLNRPSPDWLEFIETLSPSAAFSALYNQLVGEFFELTFTVDAFYRTSPALVALMLGWIVLPLVAGYLVFERADLS